MLSQLTVFLENEKGRLAQLCRDIADAGINMHSLFLADTADFGVARIFCDSPHQSLVLLKEAGYRASVTRVLGVQAPDRKGGLADLLEFIDEQRVSVEYVYCFSVNKEFAIAVLKVHDEGIERNLVDAGYKMIDEEEIYKQ